jgi:type IV secretion system protein VirD4
MTTQPRRLALRSGRLPPRRGPRVSPRRLLTRPRPHRFTLRSRRLVPHPLAWLSVFTAGLLAAAALLRLPRWHPTHRQTAIASFALLAAAALFLSLRDRRRARGRLSTAHGSARWGDPRPLVRPRGLILGQAAATFRPVGQGRAPLLRLDDEEAHLLTLAPTGSGKGIAAVLPNLLDYRGSVLTTDIKGEAYAVSARFRRDTLGHMVAALDPFSLAVPANERACYNPLDLVNPARNDAYDNARLIASMLVVPEPGQHEPFWDEEAASLLAGVVLHVAWNAAPGDRHLGTVRHLLTLGATDFSSLLGRMERTDACHGLIRRAAHRIRQKDERLLSGVLASTNRHTEFLDSPHLLSTLTRSTFRLEDLKHWRLSVYLILPPHHLRAHARWLRLLVASAVRVLTMTPGLPTWRVLFLLDEFAALGRMQSIEEAITYARGYGVSLWLLTQDLAQLRDLYPRSWETLLANVKVLQSFGTADHFTAEHLSRLTGQATVRTRGSHRTRGSTSAGNWWLPHQQQSSAEQAGETARRLLLADEIRRLPPDRQLLFLSGREPLSTRRVDYRAVRALARRADPNPMYRDP